MEYARYEEPAWVARQDSAGKSSAITWLVIGLGVGAGAALLLAPASGRELRAALSRQCRSALNGISRGTQELRARGSNLVNFRKTNKKLQHGGKE
jgi:gas vesicle protein